MVVQRRCGTAATRRWPRSARPCVRVMLVLAQVSPTNTQRAGSTRPWCCVQRARLRATSGRFCSAARRLFLKVSRSADRKRHQASLLTRVPRKANSARSAHRQVRNRRNPGQKPGPLMQQNRTPPAAHRLGRAATRHGVPLHPADYGCFAEIEPAGDRTPGLTCLDERNGTMAQIEGVGPGHTLPASNPASSLNQSSARAGSPRVNSERTRFRR